MQTSSAHAAPPMRVAFYVTLVLTLAFKFWLAKALPMTGDEAYFIYWGVYPDYGFYDHPPMVDDPGRSAATVPGRMGVAPAGDRSTRAGGARHAANPAAGGRRQSLPGGARLPARSVNVWNVLITTDTPLVLFSALSALCFAAALRSESQLLYAAAGFLLGLAFPSKYLPSCWGWRIWRLSRRSPQAGAAGAASRSHLQACCRALRSMPGGITTTAGT
jgi:hypothetical protein